ncbi:hypothetical protein Dimus_019372 [Dionaea muscipula]
MFLMVRVSFFLSNSRVVGGQVVLLPQSCIASVRIFDTMTKEFRGCEMSWIDNNGLFLLSNDSTFALGFQPAQDVTLFLLVIVHMASNTVVWTANRGSPVSNSDNFVFDNQGKVALLRGGDEIWSPVPDGKPVSKIQLQNSGNLVLYGKEDNTMLWQSFSHPTDTLLSNQEFSQGMKLSSDPSPSSGNLSYFLEIKSGDMILSAGFPSPQPYWSMARDSRKLINKGGGGGGVITSASMHDNSWKLYDRSKALLWQFVFSTDVAASLNSTWSAVLGGDGSITFSNLQSGIKSTTSIPSDRCGKPEACGAYYACSPENCLCPSGLISRNCNIGTVYPACPGSKDSTELVNAGDDLNYFALGFVQPSAAKTDLNSCKQNCVGNCSCLALFFDNSSGSCFLFDSVGSFRYDTSSQVAAYIKVSKHGTSNGAAVGGSTGNGNGSKKLVPILLIAIFTVVVVISMLYGGYRYYDLRRESTKAPAAAAAAESSEDDVLESISGMPVRYSYKDLQSATDNFSVKLGQGGFGSVYQGALPDGTRIAVKKLEGIGQGKKEFRAEVSIIGSIHHVHLVRLKGFCNEGSHRLLAYEYMANGSLERWIFKKKQKNKSDGDDDDDDDVNVVLDWETRFTIALGTAKGLAYLHEDCDVKILHCDIKPENVLLDDHFEAKLSDFGLAKLMTREQTHVFTTLRGTRGYLAPEWITNYAISEKSDVYSYGMVLLEIIGGRKNYDSSQSSEKSHFPSYAFKMMEEGRLREIVDSSLKHKPDDESVCGVVRVALWCIQEDMSLRPPMSRVVQMLEGICPVPEPPSSSPRGTRLYSSFFKMMTTSDSTSGSGTARGATSSAPSDSNSSDTYISALRLSGPR